MFQMLRRAIELCPAELWDQRTDEPPFWQQAYHTIWGIDFYLSDSPENFRSASFIEGEAANLKHIPTKTPSPQQINDYLKEVIQKCETVLNSLTTEQLQGENAFPWTGTTPAHRHIYSIRHAQHHVGWLNSILARRTDTAAEWAT